MVRDEIEPPRDFGRSHFMCQRCQWRDICWQGVDVYQELIESAGPIITEDEFEEALQSYIELSSDVKTKTGQKDEAKGVIDAYMRQSGSDSHSVRGVGNVKMVNSHRPSVDWKELNALLNDLEIEDDIRSRVVKLTESTYSRVTPVKR